MFLASPRALPVTFPLPIPQSTWPGATLLGDTRGSHQASAGGGLGLIRFLYLPIAVPDVVGASLGLQRGGSCSVGTRAVSWFDSEFGFSWLMAWLLTLGGAQSQPFRTVFGGHLVIGGATTLGHRFARAGARTIAGTALNGGLGWAASPCGRWRRLTGIASRFRGKGASGHAKRLGGRVYLYLLVDCFQRFGVATLQGAGSTPLILDGRFVGESLARNPKENLLRYWKHYNYWCVPPSKSDQRFESFRSGSVHPFAGRASVRSFLAILIWIDLATGMVTSPGKWWSARWQCFRNSAPRFRFHPRRSRWSFQCPCAAGCCASASRVDRWAVATWWWFWWCHWCWSPHYGLSCCVREESCGDLWRRMGVLFAPPAAVELQSRRVRAPAACELHELLWLFSRSRCLSLRQHPQDFGPEFGAGWKESWAWPPAPVGLYAEWVVWPWAFPRVVHGVLCSSRLIWVDLERR